MEIDLKTLHKNKYFLLCVIFFISFAVHLIGINKIGRTWDEQFKVDAGYMAWGNLGRGDFSLNSWDYGTEHPMVAKYIYGFFIGPHLIRIDDGRGNYANISPIDIEALTRGSYLKTQIGNELYMVSYDLTTPRLVSAFFNSLAVVLTVVIAMLFLSGFWSFVSGMFLIFIPRLLVMGQLITYESLTVFLFTLTILVFYKLLSNPLKLRYYVYTGILCGLLFWTRYNNYLIFIILAGFAFIDFYFKRNKKIFNPRLILIPIIAFFLGIIIWPYVWIDFPKNLIESFASHQNRVIPSVYYLNRLIVTTPIPVLLGLVIGIIFSLKKKSYWGTFLFFWFLAVLLINMVIGSPMGGIRYIIVIFPAIVILGAYGYSQILKKKWIYSLVPIFAFMIIELAMYYPYYLDYYNLLIGGVKGASKLKYEISWWGEGQRDVGFYVNKNVPNGSSVGYFVVPRYVAPNTKPTLKNVGFIDDNGETPDYVVLSRWRISEFESKYKNKYDVVYSEKVMGEDLVLLMKKK